MLFSGIKQGLPLSPYLFLFYINDVFDYLDGIFSTTNQYVFDNLHILVHADDANLIATTRHVMLRKLKSMLNYSIILPAKQMLLYCSKRFTRG